MVTPLHSLMQEYFPEAVIDIVDISIVLILILVAAYASLRLTRQILVPILDKIMLKTSAKWDDAFVERKFFHSLCALAPIVVVYAASDVFFAQRLFLAEVLRRVSMTLLVLAGLNSLTIFLTVLNDIYLVRSSSKDKPIAGYLSFLKIVIYLFSGIFIIGILTDKSPWGIFSVLGGLTAVLILVFKDTIQGFVASLQLSGNHMVRVGDWIEMPKYDADGDVVEVTIHTVKVQNWDKTITTIPTYALVTQSFKNWRGMSESGGRRIKRSVSIDMNSIEFCSQEMLARLSKFALIHDYVEGKNKEIHEYNARLGTDLSAVPNGRSQTNIGVFRAYLKAYLSSHPSIHQDMTFLVRQLPPTSKGLPMEIYVFSNDQVWANYEAIQADIFDHILAIIPEFGLKVYQDPSGADFQALNAGITGNS